jgi:hypothetical protein
VSKAKNRKTHSRLRHSFSGIVLVFIG